MIKGETTWLPEELDALRQMWADKVRVEDMETKLGRGRTAIYSKAQKIGLPSRKNGKKNMTLRPRGPACPRKADIVPVRWPREPTPLERAAAVLRGRLAMCAGTPILDGRPTRTVDVIAAANAAGESIMYPGLA